MDEYRCEARTTPLTRNDDDIWFICRYRVEIYSNGGQIVITVQLLRCWIFDPGEGEDEASLTLDCAGGPGDVPLPRGSTASCAASLERGNEDAGEAVFEWESNDTTWTDSSGTGASNWGGVATNTTDITVTVITGDEVKDTLSETVTVSVEARKWPFQYVSAPWGFSSQITSMALYDLPLAPSTVPPASEGSGPWEGQFYMASPPQAHPTIWIHSDYSGAAGPQEPGASNTCAAAANLASANLYKVNDACNRLSAMLAFRDSIIAHERLHEDGVNACLSSPKARTMLDNIEKLVGDHSTVTTGAQSAWSTFYRSSLNTSGYQARGFYIGSSFWWYDRHIPIMTWLLSYPGIQNHPGGQHSCP